VKDGLSIGLNFPVITASYAAVVGINGVVGKVPNIPPSGWSFSLFPESEFPCDREAFDFFGVKDSGAGNGSDNTDSTVRGMIFMLILRVICY
jgi:hypothetical protein